MNLLINTLSEQQIITSYNFARFSDVVFSETLTHSQYEEIQDKEDAEVDAIKQLAGIVSKASTPQTAYSEELKKLAGINEFATAGATSAGNIASVANPAQAKGQRPKDSKGLPKAPQKKKADGTAENALDIKDNLMGGATVRR